jgi:hypothetical protein
MKLHTIGTDTRTDEVRLSSFSHPTDEGNRLIEFVSVAGDTYRLELTQSELAHLNTVVANALANMLIA